MIFKNQLALFCVSPVRGPLVFAPLHTQVCCVSPLRARSTMISSTKDGSSAKLISSAELRSSSSSIESTGADSHGHDSDRLYDEAELGGEEELLQDTPAATPDAHRHRHKSLRPGGVRTAWLVRCANEWCARSGGEALCASPRERSYEELAASSDISAEDAEQIDMVCICTLCGTYLLPHP